MKHSFERLLHAGWTNFKRNSYVSFAVTGVMALVLILFLGLLSFQFLTSRVIASLEEKVDISAYFVIDAKESDILILKKDIENLAEVREVAYTTREQTLEAFKARHADSPIIQESLNQLDGNIFGATLNIQAHDPTKYAGVADFLERSPYRGLMSKIDYHENRKVIDRITGLSRALGTWGFVATLIIAGIAVLITFNTVRLTIYNQKQEIEIMRLVGASNWYIRGPYIVEGGLYGLIAALFALVVFYPLVYAISGTLTRLVPETNIFRYFLQHSWQVVLMMIVAGLALGILSSLIAIRKHLKI